MKLYIIFILISTIVLSSFSFLQTSDPTTGLTFHFENHHDALWHLALMNAVNRSLPPQNPLLEGERLVGYHYVNDLFWVGVSKLTGISFLTMYLKISPVILAGFFSLTTLVLFQKICKEDILVFIGAGIALLGSGFAYVVPFLSQSSRFSQSVFWLDQPIHLGINQQLLLSLSIVNIVLLLIVKSYKKNWLLIGLLSGGVMAIKVYASLALMVVFLIVAIWQFVQHKQVDFLKIAFTTVIFALPFVLLIGNTQGFPFLFEPGWFFKTMFESGERLNLPRWEMMRLDAMVNHSWHRVIILWSSAFVIFFLGNFGLKILGIFALPYILRHEKTTDVFWWLLTILVVFCCAMPTLFLQKGVVWNTIQFLPYCFIPLVMLLVKGIDVSMTSQKKKIAVLIMIIVLSLPATVMTLFADFQKTSFISVSSVLATDIQKLNEIKGKTILLDAELQKTSLIPALSNQTVYVADQSVLSILGMPHEERRQYSLDVELGKQVCSSDQVFVTLKNRITVESCPRILISMPGSSSL